MNLLSYVSSYLNSLALFHADDEKVSSIIRRFLADYKYYDNYTYSIGSGMLKNVGKRLYVVNVRDLLSLGKSKADWDEIMPAIIHETQENRYILIMHHIEELFNKANTENHYLGRYLFFLTRGKTKLTFIAPVTWQNYVAHVENGQFGNMLHHRRPVYFSPRPENLPPYFDHMRAYDNHYLYKENL